MPKKQKIKKIFNNVIYHSPVFMVGVLSFLLFILLIYGVSLFIPKQVLFGIDRENCIKTISILPVNNDDGADVVYRDRLEIFGVGVLSFKTCFLDPESISVGTHSVRGKALGGLFYDKYSLMVADTARQVTKGSFEETDHSVSDFSFELSSDDLLKSYFIEINKKVIDCERKADKQFFCDIRDFGLSYNTEYLFEIKGHYKNDNVELIKSGSIKTIGAVSVVSSSIGNGETVFKNLDSISFVFDKKITSAKLFVKKDEDIATQELMPEITGDTITASLPSLERKNSYTISITDIDSIDGSGLAGQHDLNFYLAGGPAVESINISNTQTSRSGRIIVDFDQELATDSEVAEYINTSFYSNISFEGGMVYIDYSGIGACQAMSIVINNGLKNIHGIASVDDWQFSTRTACYSIETIGYTNEGRAINAYIFGGGAEEIMYIGAIHGNEYSSMYLMNAWIEELDNNTSKIPNDKRIIVIPVSNPDGVAAYTRNNTNNIDLNRNFPTVDWQSDVYTPSNQLLSGGGGGFPLSEIESQVLANYSSEIMPTLTLTFHSMASCVIANQAGNSSSKAVEYASLSGYANQTGNSINTFSYPITGTFDDWMAQELYLPSVLVELSSNTDSQFSKNKSALWAMIQ